jgi:hypothetical protein
VDSLNGCFSDSSSQKKPRLYGSPKNLNSSKTAPPENKIVSNNNFGKEVYVKFKLIK